MSLKKYNTVSNEQIFNAEYEIQRSRFISYVKYIETEEEAKDFVQQIKKKHFDARHNCSAWVIGVNGDKQKSNDDGEPGGTAGNPILGVIKNFELTNTAIVVTRYFGGIKLGTGGLIRAYSHTATLGLNASQILTMTPMQKVSFTVNYNLLASVENWTRKKNISVDNIDYSNNATLTLLIAPDEVDARLEELTDLTAANFTHRIDEEILIAVKN